MYLAIPALITRMHIRRSLKPQVVKQHKEMKVMNPEGWQSLTGRGCGRFFFRFFMKSVVLFVVFRCFVVLVVYFL